MKAIPLKLVTIICEPVLTQRLITAIKKFGASGFTLTEVTGEGRGETNSGELPEQKVKIEVVAPPEVALAILDHLAENYFHDYALITFASDVMGLRPGKFAAKK